MYDGPRLWEDSLSVSWRMRGVMVAPQWGHDDPAQTQGGHSGGELIFQGHGELGWRSCRESPDPLFPSLPYDREVSGEMMNNVKQEYKEYLTASKQSLLDMVSMYVMGKQSVIGSKMSSVSTCDIKVWVGKEVWSINSFSPLKVATWKKKRIRRENSWRYRYYQNKDLIFRVLSFWQEIELKW